MTTFASRELIRDEIASKFQAFTGSGQILETVYNYFPSVRQIANKSPLLFVTSAGTARVFNNLETNPSQHRFFISVMVLAYDAAGNWGSDDAEDKLDDLDRLVGQVVRDNAGSMTRCNQLIFENGFSNVENVIVEGLPYIRETWAVVAHLNKGAI